MKALRGTLLLGALLLAALLVAGCATGAGQGGGQGGGQAPVAGHLAGRLLMEGGPMGPGGQQPGERPIPGTVTFTAAGHQGVTVKVGPSGTFSVRLPPGRYQVSGRSPNIRTVDGGSEQELPCSQPMSATVTAGHTAAITVTCIVP